MVSPPMAVASSGTTASTPSATSSIAAGPAHGLLGVDEPRRAPPRLQHEVTGAHRVRRADASRSASESRIHVGGTDIGSAGAGHGPSVICTRPCPATTRPTTAASTPAPASAASAASTASGADHHHHAEAEVEDARHLVVVDVAEPAGSPRRSAARPTRRRSTTASQSGGQHPGQVAGEAPSGDVGRRVHLGRRRPRPGPPGRR